MSLRELNSSDLQQPSWYLRTSVFFQGQNWVGTQGVRNLPAMGVTTAPLPWAGVNMTVPYWLPTSKPYLLLIYAFHENVSQGVTRCDRMEGGFPEMGRG